MRLCWRILQAPHHPYQQVYTCVHALTVHRNLHRFPSDLYGCVHALRYALKHAAPAPRTTALSVRTHHIKVYVHIYMYILRNTACIQTALIKQINSVYKRTIYMHVISALVFHTTTYTCICTYSSCVPLQDVDLTSSLVTSTHHKVQRIHTALNEVRNSTAILEANLGRTTAILHLHVSIIHRTSFSHF